MSALAGGGETDGLLGSASEALENPAGAPEPPPPPTYAPRPLCVPGPRNGRLHQPTPGHRLHPDRKAIRELERVVPTLQSTTRPTIRLFCTD